MDYIKCISRDSAQLAVIGCGYDNKTTEIDIKLDILKQVPSVWVDMAFLCKVGSQFRKFGSTEKLDWCAVIRKVKSIKNSYVRKMVELMKKALPNIFSCPFFGQLVIHCWINNKVFNVLPPGEYSLELSFYDKNGPAGVNISIGFKQTLTSL